MSQNDVLKVQGVNFKGFGIIPKAVMQDTRLTRDAKSIYAYFCSFAGSGDTAFPSISKICFDLCFGSEDTFRKHFNLLKKHDYIRVQQEKIKGKFSRNIYTIIQFPSIEGIDNSSDSPSPKFYGTVKEDFCPSPKFPGTVFSGTEDRGTNNNSIKINITKNKTTTTKDTYVQNNVVVVEPVSSDDIGQLKTEIDTKLKIKFSLKQLYKLIDAKGIDKVKYYLEHYGEYAPVNTKSIAGTFSDMIMADNYCKTETYTNSQTKANIPQARNFDQRTYSDEEYESLYCNV